MTHEDAGRVDLRDRRSEDLELEVPAKYCQEILTNYEIGETIGRGGYAVVKRGVHKLTSHEVAIKIMSKQQLIESNDLHRVDIEVKALIKLRHEHIIQLYQVVQDGRFFYLIMELADEGDLCDYLDIVNFCKNDDARVKFRQILAAVGFCHKKGYVLRDLKLDNLLLTRHGVVKLIDFGLVSKPATMSDMLTTVCGSRSFAAPEVTLCIPYRGDQADMFSLGAILFTLVAGSLPFPGETNNDKLRRIRRGMINTPPWVSASCERLVRRLLCFDPSKRPTMEEVLCDPWVVGLDSPINVEIGSRLSKGHVQDYDRDVLAVLGRYFNECIEAVVDVLNSPRPNHAHALYEITRLRRRNGLKEAKLPPGGGRLPKPRTSSINRPSKGTSSSSLST